jgi:malate synthase
MSQTTTVLHASQALEDDHHRLHTLIDRLRVSLDLAGMATALTELHGALTSHFNAEERPGGLYDSLGVCVPEFRERLGELVDDHFRFASLVRDLAQRAHEAEGAAADALRADVARLLTALSDHERREQEMVKAAVKRTA